MRQEMPKQFTARAGGAAFSALPTGGTLRTPVCFNGLAYCYVYDRIKMRSNAFRSSNRVSPPLTFSQRINIKREGRGFPGASFCWRRCQYATQTTNSELYPRSTISLKKSYSYTNPAINKSSTPNLSAIIACAGAIGQVFSLLSSANLIHLSNNKKPRSTHDSLRQFTSSMRCLSITLSVYKISSLFCGLVSVWSGCLEFSRMVLL